ncbi:polysaccharide biosynthesis/export family protein, partial [Sulfitobacter sp.]|uniref:polysaccharide biosynthesis/export family protein n=1 Tax=Sulfitobacter sp. TaxID=1903071 RepID=UPI004058128F
RAMSSERNGSYNMKQLFTRMTKILFTIVLVSALGACGLPRSGPKKAELLDVKMDKYSNTEIVVVDENVTRAVALPADSGFPHVFVDGSSSAPDQIRPGDTLSFTIYENVDDGVLSRGNSGAATLNALQVDEAGFIFIPYAGRIRAAGNTPEALRRIITNKLNIQTPQPQVLVQRAPGDGATVSILGDGIASQGVYPIQRSSRRLMEMLATAGGITAPSEVARITVLRNHTKGEIWFEDIYDRPEFDIALYAGDRVLVQRDPRVFTVLGATGLQANVPFGMRHLSALQALAQVGGLDGSIADPTGLFVIRNVQAKSDIKGFGRGNHLSDKTIIYVLDLTKPNGVPLARNFDMRDGDTLYVTEAPYVQWTKTLSVLVGSVRAARTAGLTTNNGL